MQIIAKLFFTSFIALAATPIFGGQEGKGGDPYCAEFSDSLGRIAAALKTMGQEKINLVNAVINESDLWNIKKRFKCKPVDQLDRQAKSFSAKTETHLDWQKFRDLKFYNRIRLIAHELCVLAEYEGDGEYFVSDDLMRLLTENSEYFKFKLQAEEVIRNPNGSVTFVAPFLVIGEKVYPFATYQDGEIWGDNAKIVAALGICRFMGRKSVETYSLSVSVRRGVTYAQLLQSGSFRSFHTQNGEWSDGSREVLSVTCK